MLFASDLSVVLRVVLKSPNRPSAAHVRTCSRTSAEILARLSGSVSGTAKESIPLMVVATGRLIA